MITIDEIKNVSFRKAGRQGYMAEDVDAFIDEVIVAFEQLKKEKTNLVHKIDVLATRVEQYRADEETVRNALLASQKVSDACIREAKEKASKIVREAETKAQQLLVDTNRMTATEKENYLLLQSDAVKLKGELIELYKKHIQMINDLPTAAELEAAKQELNEKYPTAPVIEEKPQETVKPAEPAAVEVKKADAETAAVSDKTVDEILSSTNAAANEKNTEKKAPKFGHLKFGDNYDVSAE